MCSRPGKPGFVFCVFYSLSPGERVRVRGSGRTELHLAPGGIDSLALALRAACSLRSQSVQLAVASCRTPVGDSHPPLSKNIKEKSPYFRTSSHLKYGGEGGIDSLALARWAACSLCSQSVQLAVASCRTPVGGSHSPPPRRRAICEKKARIFMRALL